MLLILPCNMDKASVVGERAAPRCSEWTVDWAVVEPVYPSVEIQSMSVSFTILTCGYTAEETSYPSRGIRAWDWRYSSTVLFEMSLCNSGISVEIPTAICRYTVEVPLSGNNDQRGYTPCLNHWYCFAWLPVWIYWYEITRKTTDSIGFINYCYSMGWIDMVATDCLE